MVLYLEMAVACTVEGLLLLLSPRTFDHSEARSFAVNSERRGDQRFLQDHWLKMVRSSVGERRASRQRVKANEEAARLSWQTAPPNSVSSRRTENLTPLTVQSSFTSLPNLSRVQRLPDNHRRYLCRQGDDFTISEVKVQRTHEFCTKLGEQLRNLDPDQPLHRPLQYFGWTADIGQRLNQHKRHQNSNEMMDLFHAVLMNIFDVSPAQRRGFTLHTIPLCFLTNPRESEQSVRGLHLPARMGQECRVRNR